MWKVKTDANANLDEVDASFVDTTACAGGESTGKTVNSPVIRTSVARINCDVYAHLPRFAAGEYRS